MPSKYWIKLYQEILEDPKMGRLPDNLWRRTIELFLLAGELGSDLKDTDPNRGHLPSTGEIAWHLRQPEERLEAELHQLAGVGILAQTDTGWLVTNFVKRQKHIEPAERMKQYRERKREKDPFPPVQDDKELVTRTVTHRNTEIESDKEIESTSKEVGDKSPGVEVIKPGPSLRRARATTIPAVQVFVDITGKFVLNNTQIKEIDERVGRDPPALDRWRETVKAWQLAGNKINGIKGMLDWFKDGIPVYAQKASTNGTHRQNNQQPTDRAGLRTPESIAAQLAAQANPPLK